MNEEQHIGMQLWNYIDGSISTEGRMRIEQLLQHNATWKSMYNQLLELHQLMKGNLETDEPSMRFTKNVMGEISKLQVARATKTYINKKIISGIAAFFIIMIGGILIYGLTQVRWSSGGGVVLPFDISKLDWSKYFNKAYLNLFLMINVVLGLMLLDKYLVKKRNSGRHKQT